MDKTGKERVMSLRTGLAAAALVAWASTGAIAQGDATQGDGQDGLNILKPFTYVQTNLVSNAPGVARTTDPALFDAWGIAFSPSNPFWISDRGAGLSTLYDGTGAKIPATFTIPQAGGTAQPTGMVWNGTGHFMVPGTSLPATFIFSTLNGTLSAWAPGETTSPLSAVTAVDNSKIPGGAIYTGIEIGITEAGAFLYAPNIATGRIDVFDASFAPANGKLPGSFVDRSVPPGYTPFNIRNIDGNLVVTYARQNATRNFVTPGAGYGYVAIFATDGTLLRHMAGGGLLNAPWGVARAPAGFGALSGKILIGNFGDGHILAFDEGQPVASLMLGTNGLPTKIPGLWALTFGGAAKADPRTLFFTAGPDGGQQGLFGSIQAAVPNGPAVSW